MRRTIIGRYRSYASVYGYMSGGFNGGTPMATTDRITFSTGVSGANTVSNLSVGKYGMSSLSDTNTYGYINGSTSGDVASTDRMFFSTGVNTANTSCNLKSHCNSTGASDGNVYGYWAGGNPDRSAIVTKLTFSTSVSAANTSNLTYGRSNDSGLSDNSLYGYISGGFGTGGDQISTTERITFSTGATNYNPTSNISAKNEGLAGLSDNSLYGYWAGGYTAWNSFSKVTYRITFSTGATSANTASNLSSARCLAGACSYDNNYGYVSGGKTDTSNGSATTSDRIVYSTSVTSANTSTNLSVARLWVTGIADGAV